jgi:hypothetical protein
MPIPLRPVFTRRWSRPPRNDRRMARKHGSFCFGGDLRRRNSHRGGEDWRRDASDRSRLGAQVQRAQAGRRDRSKSARTSASAERGAPSRARRDHRERPPYRFRNRLSSIPIYSRCLGHVGANHADGERTVVLNFLCASGINRRLGKSPLRSAVGLNLGQLEKKPCANYSSSRLLDRWRRLPLGVSVATTPALAHGPPPTFPIRTECLRRREAKIERWRRAAGSCSPIAARRAPR